MAITLDFNATQGDSFYAGPFQYQVGTTPLPLTGATGKCQVRADPASGVIAELTVVVDVAATGWYHVEATPAVMKSIPAPDTPTTDYYQDVKFTWASGFVKTLTKGALHLTPEVTR